MRMAVKVQIKLMLQCMIIQWLLWMILKNFVLEMIILSKQETLQVMSGMMALLGLLILQEMKKQYGFVLQMRMDVQIGIHQH